MNWTTEYPTRPGRYWFYGWVDRVFSRKNRLPQRMKMVEATTTGGGVTCHADGEFIFPNQCLGLWLPMETPEPPVSDIWANEK